MIARLKQRWQGPGGCRDVLRLSLPLILSMNLYTIQTFVDRVFLMSHSTAEMAAAFPAGLMGFAFACLFTGTVGYVNTFVAQYTGAGRDQRVGPAVWQGLFFASAASFVLVLIRYTAEPIFNWLGHDPEVRAHEIVYFRIICLGRIPLLMATTLSCFFTGRGRTWVVLAVDMVAVAVNIVLDYGMIYGRLGFPEWGIFGAGLATGIANIAAALVYLLLFLKKDHRRRYATTAGARWDRDLFARLMRFGLPNGVHFMIDVLAFTLFVGFMGRLGKTVMAATNIAFDINCIAYIPMIGVGTGVIVMVGQALGKDNPDLAQRSIWSGFILCYFYKIVLAIGFVLIPDVFMYPFARAAQESNPAEFVEIAAMVRRFLIFVAIYSLFEPGNIVFAAGLKGAGDTRFVMIISMLLHWLVMTIPTYLAVRFGWGPGEGLYLGWIFITAFVCMLAVSFLLRLLQGKWKSMRVIEAVPPAGHSTLPELPTTEIDSF
ncbi:MAG: MATE family efflux transporter [Sedimentisphaerales bacterium]|nr:MATE family efflux transporter [Sedimentisphaerales bacterium]